MTNGKNGLKIMIEPAPGGELYRPKIPAAFDAYGLTMGQLRCWRRFTWGDLTVGQVQEKILSTNGTIPLIVNNLEKRAAGKNDGTKTTGASAFCILTERPGAYRQVYPQNEKIIIEQMSCWTADEQEAGASAEKFGMTK